MRILALDLGERRTGCAYVDTKEVGFPVPLPTLQHSSEDERKAHVLALIHTRSIEHVIIGLPLLPGGSEGAEARGSRLFGDALAKTGIQVTYRDERYTSQSVSHVKNPRKDGGIRGLDRDKMAAIAILEGFLKN